MSALGQYRNLSAEQKAILRDKEVRLHRNADDLLTLLEPVADFNAKAASTRSKTGCLMAVLVLVAMWCFIAGLKGDGRDRIEFLGVAVVLSVAAGWLWYGILRPLSPKRAAVSSNLRDVVLPFLRILREEVPEDELLQVQIALDPLESDSHLLSGKGTNERIYLQPWFQGHAAFADGTRLRWRVVDRLRSRTRTRRGSSGKMKTKTKRTRRSDVAVRLGFPSKRYAAAADRVGNATMKEDDKRLTVLLKRSEKDTSGADVNSFDLLLGAIADGYRGVTARKGA